MMGKRYEIVDDNTGDVVGVVGASDSFEATHNAINLLRESGLGGHDYFYRCCYLNCLDDDDEGEE